MKILILAACIAVIAAKPTVNNSNLGVTEAAVQILEDVPSTAIPESTEVPKSLHRRETSDEDPVTDPTIFLGSDLMAEESKDDPIPTESVIEVDETIVGLIPDFKNSGDVSGLVFLEAVKPAEREVDTVATNDASINKLTDEVHDDDDDDDDESESATTESAKVKRATDDEIVAILETIKESIVDNSSDEETESSTTKSADLLTRARREISESATEQVAATSSSVIENLASEKSQDVKQGCEKDAELDHDHHDHHDDHDHDHDDHDHDDHCHYHHHESESATTESAKVKRATDDEIVAILETIKESIIDNSSDEEPSPATPTDD